MRYLLILAFSLYSTVSNASITCEPGFHVKTISLKNTQNHYCYNESTNFQNYSGIMVTTENNGTLITQASYIDNEYYGLVKQYNKGKLVEDMEYKAGERHGLQYKYHKNGRVKLKQTWQDGKITGTSVLYNEDGSLSQKFEFNHPNSDKVTRIQYKKDGSTFSPKSISRKRAKILISWH